MNVARYEATSLEPPNPDPLNRRRITIAGSDTCKRAEFDEVISATTEGRIKNPEAVIAARMSLERAVENGFRQLVAGVEGRVKILENSSSGAQQVWLKYGVLCLLECPFGNMTELTLLHGSASS